VNCKSFPNAASQGLTVFEASVPDLKAIQEIETLFSHVYARIKAPQIAKHPLRKKSKPLSVRVEVFPKRKINRTMASKVSV